MKKWLRIIGAIVMSGLCAVALILTWDANQFVVFRGFNEFPISERLLLGVGVLFFLLSGFFNARKVRQ